MYMENSRIYEVYALLYIQKSEVFMNIVIISGKIISEIEFNFIYNGNKKEKHTSIAMCKLRLDNGSFVDIYGYDEIADYLYRNKVNCIWIEGKLDNHMMIEIKKINC